jgi:hypothetical protein
MSLRGVASLVQQPECFSRRIETRRHDEAIPCLDGDCVATATLRDFDATPALACDLLNKSCKCRVSNLATTFIIYWSSCQILKSLTTETLSHGAFFIFSQYLRDSVVQKGVINHSRLHMQKVYFMRSNPLRTRVER